MKLVRPLFLALIALWSISLASAQVVIYDVDFDEVGESVNYRGFESGFFVMPLEGGTADFILEFREGTTRFFVQVPDFGTFFIATEGNERRGVIANTGDGGTPINFFAAVGDLNTNLSANVTTTDANNVSTTSSVQSTLPRRFDGHILTADPSTGGIFDANAGAAGASELRADLDLIRTNRANSLSQTQDEAVAALVTELERSGQTEFVVDVADTTAADTTTDGTATTTATN